MSINGNDTCDTRQPTGFDSMHRTQLGQKIHNSIPNVGFYLFNNKCEYEYYDITTERHDIIPNSHVCRTSWTAYIYLHNLYCYSCPILMFFFRKSSICEVVTVTAMVVSVAAASASVENPTIDKMQNVRPARAFIRRFCYISMPWCRTDPHSSFLRSFRKTKKIIQSQWLILSLVNLNIRCDRANLLSPQFRFLTAAKRNIR